MVHADKWVRKKRRKLTLELQKLDSTLVISEQPTRYRLIQNTGISAGFGRGDVIVLLKKFQVSPVSVLLVYGRSYSVVELHTLEDAIHLNEMILAEEPPIAPMTPARFPVYLGSLPLCSIDPPVPDLPTGLRCLPGFVSPEDEARLLELVECKLELQTTQRTAEDHRIVDGKVGEELGSVTGDVSAKTPVATTLRRRRVLHFGYNFDYSSNSAGDVCEPIPQVLSDIGKRAAATIQLDSDMSFDQVTINVYEPGHGIPPHVDTHSRFGEAILSLSLAADTVMEFSGIPVTGDRTTKPPNQELVMNKPDLVELALPLPRRSLLCMTGESRYGWRHAIRARQADIKLNQDEVFDMRQLHPGFCSEQLDLVPRARRVSVTFRQVTSGSCTCRWPSLCDSQQLSASRLTEEEAGKIERACVRDVYDSVASHFSATRHKRWPQVVTFLESLPAHSLVLDAGCGNGKYLNSLGCHGDNSGLIIGSDFSVSLCTVCRQRECEVAAADCLNLPWRNSSFDAVISIAVLHHFTTQLRRERAVSELVRVLRPGGRCLITVWAKEQEGSVYASRSDDTAPGAQPGDPALGMNLHGLDENLLFPVHKPKTTFATTDVCVPWREAGGDQHLRFYHVFVTGELRALCESAAPGCEVIAVVLHEGNWCVEFVKN